jgi:hypothetical protein
MSSQTATLTNAASSAGGSTEVNAGLRSTNAAGAAGMAPLPHHPSSSEIGIRLPDSSVLGLARSINMSNEEFERYKNYRAHLAYLRLDHMGLSNGRLPYKYNVIDGLAKSGAKPDWLAILATSKTVPKNGAAPAGGAGSGERRNRKNSRRNNMMGGKRRHSRRNNMMGGKRRHSRRR